MSDAAKVDPQKTTLAKEHKHSRPLTTCHWEPKSRFIFFGAEDNLVHRYELASGKVVSLAAHDSWVRAYGSSPNGDVLLSGGYDGRLIFWPAFADAPTPTRTIQAHDGWIRAVAVSSDGRFIATCGNDNLVKLWDAASGAPLQTYAGHKKHVYNVMFSQDSKTVYSCDQKGVVISWSVDSPEPNELVTVKVLHGYDTTFRADIGGARGIALRNDGQQLALGGISKVTNAFAGVGETAVALVNLKDRKVERVLQSKDKTKGTIWGVTHHPDGYWIGLSGGGGGGWLWFWKGDADHEFFKLKLKNDGRGLSIAPDRRSLVVAHADAHLRTYSMPAAT